MLGLIFLLLGLIPALVAGPLAGLIFINILRRSKYWMQIPFWGILIILDVLFMVWSITSRGTWLPISSVSAFFFTPATAVVTFFVMRYSWRRLDINLTQERMRKRRFTSGIIGIPALQIGMFAALIIFTPGLCKIGLVICQGS
jgi:hypothetical protein